VRLHKRSQPLKVFAGPQVRQCKILRYTRVALYTFGKFFDLDP